MKKLFIVILLLVATITFSQDSTLVTSQPTLTTVNQQTAFEILQDTSGVYYVKFHPEVDTTELNRVFNIIIAELNHWLIFRK